MSTPLKSEVLPSGKLQFGLARFNDVYFLIATRCLGMLQGCSRITHKLNETRGFNEPVRMLWLNCDSGNGENSDALMSPFNILLNADPPVFVPTGRRRKEISAENGDEIDCPEFELVIREDQLFRQCYYCLGWDDDWDRLLKMEGDYYWCNSVCLFDLISSIHVVYILCSARVWDECMLITRECCTKR